MRRTEIWTRDGRTASVDVHDEIVLVAYEVLAQMLVDLGFVREESADDGA